MSTDNAKQLIDDMYQEENLEAAMVVFGDPLDQERMIVSGQIEQEDWVKMLAKAAVFCLTGVAGRERECLAIQQMIRHVTFIDDVYRNDAGLLAVRKESPLFAAMVGDRNPLELYNLLRQHGLTEDAEHGDEVVAYRLALAESYISHAGIAGACKIAQGD